MPLSWTININPNPAKPPLVCFDPDPPHPQIEPGDQIIWANNDTQAHWPGLQNSNGTINETFFMPNQIAPHSSSPAFAPSSSGTLNYTCSLHPDEKGAIQVIAADS